MYDPMTLNNKMIVRYTKMSNDQQTIIQRGSAPKPSSQNTRQVHGEKVMRRTNTYLSPLNRVGTYLQYYLCQIDVVRVASVGREALLPSPLTVSPGRLTFNASLPRASLNNAPKLETTTVRSSFSKFTLK